MSKRTMVGSQSDANQGRPNRPLPNTEQARPVPDCLIGLDRLDRIGSWNIALSVFITLHWEWDWGLSDRDLGNASKI